MSSTPSQSLAPFLMRSWQPLLRGESMRPGTAKTWRPYSLAKLAVMSAPLVRLASTTTVPSVMPATMRLRMGKDCLSAGRLKGKLGDQRTVGSDLLEQLRILGRRNQVYAGA